MTRVGQTNSPAASARTNVSGLNTMFGERQIDALVCRAGINVAYLSGIAAPGTLGRHLDLTDTDRETPVLWHPSGEPVVMQQLPLLVEGSTDVLQAGMAVAIEPISGHWHLQDEYLTTESSPISTGFRLEELPWTG